MTFIVVQCLSLIFVPQLVPFGAQVETNAKHQNGRKSRQVFKVTVTLPFAFVEPTRRLRAMAMRLVVLLALRLAVAEEPVAVPETQAHLQSFARKQHCRAEISIMY